MDLPTDDSETDGEQKAESDENGKSEAHATTLSLLDNRPLMTSLQSDDFDLHLSEGCELLYFRLFSACASGDAAVVRNCLSKLSVPQVTQLNPLSDSDAYGLTPLHVARTVTCVRLLLTAGVPVDLPGVLGQTALHTHHDNAAVVGFLVKNEASVDAKTRTNGSTPLQWAVAADQEAVVVTLLDAGADVNYQNFAGNTALHLVVSASVAKVLVGRGARTDVVNRDGKVPVEDASLRAVDEAHYEVAMYLLDLSKKQFMFLNDFFEEDDAFEDDFQLGCESTTAFEKYHDMKKRISDNEEMQAQGSNASSAGGFEGDTAAEVSSQGSESSTKKKTKGLKHRLNSIRESCSVGDAETNAVNRWQMLKRSFIGRPPAAAAPRNGVSGSKKARGEEQKYGLNTPLHRHVKRDRRQRSRDSVHDSEEFYSAFFEVTVKWKPKLAKKLLDKQRSFLYWENSNRVYRYNTSLLGTVPNSSSAMKQMILDNQVDLIAHPVVQFSLTARWILFTREVLFYEATMHFIWLMLIVLTTLTESREIKLVKAVTSWEIIQDPFEVLVLLANFIVLLMNLRFMNLHLVHTKISCITSGKKLSLYDVLHSRQEYFYLVTNLVLFVSQILRCLPDAALYHNIADICCAMVTWRLFLRQLHFFECFESIGVPM